METGCRLALVGALCIAGLSMLVAILREHRLRRDSQHGSDRGVAHLLGVGWHPTPRASAAAALAWAKVKAGDVLYELGCGDGVVALEAVRLGASAVCVERDPDMAARARIALRPAGLSARVLVQDLFDVDLSEATVVYTFLLPAMNARLRATTFGTLSRGPGVRVISREFDIYGWPCGERFRHGGVRFLKWELPVVDVASDSAHAESQQSFDENLVVEHMLDCNAEESAMESGEHDSDELTGNE